MMKKEIKVPSVGESIQEATIAKWHKKTGDYVETNQELLTLETDKAGVEIVSEFSGVLTIKVEEGKVVQIGTLIGEIDTDAARPAPRPPAAGASASNGAAKPTPPPPPAGVSASSTGAGFQTVEGTLSPAVRRIVSEKGLDPASVQGTGKDGRLTKQDVMTAQPGGAQPATSPKPAERPTPLPVPGMTTRTGGTRRVPMTTIRKRIAERLVQAQHTAAILTTFNEIDMSSLLSLREKYKEKFKERYGVNLGMMGFFVKAAIEALKAFPQVNAFIDGTDIVYNDFFNVGVAVGTEKGLIVPVIRDADQLSLSEIELTIRHFAQKARDGKISIDDLRDGTFTISNGGVYGSLMSTPILNPPQSGILGMHKVEDRAVVVNKEIVIRPMMYVALSYDHRMIDGSEAVSFLVKIKENIEDPQRLLLEV